MDTYDKSNNDIKPKLKEKTIYSKVHFCCRNEKPSKEATLPSSAGISTKGGLAPRRTKLPSDRRGTTQRARRTTRAPSLALPQQIKNIPKLT